MVWGHHSQHYFGAWALQKEAQKLFQGLALGHMHHCMSLDALEQGLLGLEAANASDIDEFV